MRLLKMQSLSGVLKMTKNSNSKLEIRKAELEMLEKCFTACQQTLMQYCTNDDECTYLTHKINACKLEMMEELEILHPVECK